jgi:hypothetical protein
VQRTDTYSHPKQLLPVHTEPKLNPRIAFCLGGGAGIISAYGLFGSKETSSQKSGADVLSAVAAAAGGGGGAGFFARVQHVVVEFGPPGRWKVAGNTPEDGAAVLAQMESDYGFEPRLIDSLVRNENGLLFLPLCINMIIYQDWLRTNAYENVASTKAHHLFNLHVVHCGRCGTTTAGCLQLRRAAAAAWRGRRLTSGRISTC